MQTMAATVLDVMNEYRGKIADLPLAFAQMLYDSRSGTLVFTTFFDDIDLKAEDELAAVEAYMVDAFSEFPLDFHTIHLMGRDLGEFVPQGAIPLTPVSKAARQGAGSR